jgi:hypothetical protein
MCRMLRKAVDVRGHRRDEASMLRSDRDAVFKKTLSNSEKLAAFITVR